MSIFILYGHPVEHGTEPCVLAYTDGRLYITAMESVLKRGGHQHTLADGTVLQIKEPVLFASEADAEATAAKIRGRRIAVETDVVLDRDGKLESYTPKPGGRVVEYAGNTEPSRVPK